MTNLTDADLAAMKARADAATPGPWDDRSGYILVEDDVRIADVFDSSDAEFIAHARADVPALLAEVAALRQQLDLAETTIEKVRTARSFGAQLGMFVDVDTAMTDYDAAKEALND